MTDITGSWSFTGLTAGKYTVRVVAEPGTTPTKPAGGVLIVNLLAGKASVNHLFGKKATS